MRDKPRLAVPVLTGPTIIRTGEGPQTFSIEPVENAAEYTIQVIGNGAVLSSMSSPTAGAFDLASLSLSSGKVYGIRAVVTADGFISGESEEKAFAVVDGDRVLELPAGLTAIEANAFEGIDAQLIILPAGIRSIAGNAFANCTDLTAVILPADFQGMDGSAFLGCPDDVLFVEEP